MKRRNATLSISSYYGGKSKMAPFIVDRLNYDDTDVFVTPFGGMCRVLLNKPRHRVECYNDYSSGLTALMRTLSNSETADIFIHRLCEETDYSEEEFLKQKDIFDYAEADLEQQAQLELKRFLVRKPHKIVPAVTADDLLMLVYTEANQIEPAKKPNKSVLLAKSKLKEMLNNDEVFKDTFQKLLGNWLKLSDLKEEQGYLERSTDNGKYISDIELAIATYITFRFSRDGMGLAFSNIKFKSTTDYKNHVLELYNCAERLEGVEIYQLDAVNFFRSYVFRDIDTRKNEIKRKRLDPAYHIINEWIDNPRVMVYCDPSYISVESERKLLEGIDVDTVTNLSNAIKKKYEGKKEPKNLGKIYAMSFNYDDQEKFVRCIQNARCKILVSNYDLQLYNKYLTPAKGWRREVFTTSTSVGGKAGNVRDEVIWYNY